MGFIVRESIPTDQRLKKDCITYEGEIISELKSDFEGAILHGMAAANVSPILTLQHVLLINICKMIKEQSLNGCSRDAIALQM